VGIKFGRLNRLLKNAQGLDETQAWFFVIDRGVKEDIILMNTEDQLEEFGIDSEGNSLGEYALRTIAEKIEKGHRHDHVTLKDTGAFYDSFVVEVDRSGFWIIADDVAFYDRPLTEVYGLEILGLTKENTEFVGDLIMENYRIYVKQELLR
jgi:hypothetical protein